MITTEGLNYYQSVAIKGGSQIQTWYVAPFTNNYTPVAGDTAAEFPALAGESTAYSATTRVPVVFGSPSGGSVDNTAARAELTFTADTTLYGAFVISTGTKGAAAGVLLATQRFAAPRTIVAGTKVQLAVDLDLLQPGA